MNDKAEFESFKKAANRRGDGKGMVLRANASVESLTSDCFYSMYMYDLQAPRGSGVRMLHPQKPKFPEDRFCEFYKDERI